MKNLTLSCLVSSLLIANLYGGDREWATACKVLTGVTAVTVIDRIINPPTVVYQQPIIIQAPIVMQPELILVQPVTAYHPAPIVVYYPYYSYGYRGHYWRRR